MLNAYRIAGLVTHALVFLIEVGAQGSGWCLWQLR
jgi:hypothetical protein